MIEWLADKQKAQSEPATRVHMYDTQSHIAPCSLARCAAYGADLIVVHITLAFVSLQADAPGAADLIKCCGPP